MITWHPGPTPSFRLEPPAGRIPASRLPLEFSPYGDVEPIQLDELVVPEGELDGFVSWLRSVRQSTS
jgi:hypothetical protein